MPRAGQLKSSGERLSDRVAVGVLTQAFPAELVDEVLTETGRVQQRNRLLPARLVVYFVMAMCLFSGQSYEEVARLCLQKEPPDGVFAEPRDHGLGRSRGGFTTKLHLAVEQGQKPLSIVVTAGQRGDAPQFEAVLGKVRAPRRCGPTAQPPGSGARRQGVRLPQEPRLPA